MRTLAARSIDNTMTTPFPHVMPTLLPTCRAAFVATQIDFTGTHFYLCSVSWVGLIRSCQIVGDGDGSFKPRGSCWMTALSFVICRKCRMLSNLIRPVIDVPLKTGFQPRSYLNVSATAKSRVKCFGMLTHLVPQSFHICIQGLYKFFT